MRIVDMHCDTISELWKKPGTGLAQNGLHIDLNKLEKGDYLLQNFAMFVNLQKEADPWDAVLQMAGVFDREMEANAERIRPVRTWADIEKNRADGVLSALLTVEEGGVLGGEHDRLRALYGMGVRMLTLTWNYPNELGFPNLTWKDGKPDFATPETKQGLTEQGIVLVQEMERMGMLVDVSHLSDAGFYDVLANTAGPFVASHSNARQLCHCVRNMTDDMIYKLAVRGGVIGLNLCADFLTEVSVNRKTERREENPGTIQAVVEHAKYIAKVGGIECLGLGTDFDGIPTHRELPDASSMPLLQDALARGGFHESQIDKILGGNVLRIYQECF